MNFEVFSSLREVQCKFIEGRSIFYACIVPNYDWFKKEFSITKIFEPISTRILSHKIINSHIDDADRSDLATSKFDISRVIRKYQFHVYFENSEKTVLSLFVHIDQTVLIKYEPNVMLGDEHIVKKKFYKELISLQNKLQHDDESVIVEDVEFKEFVNAYENIVMYHPEEIIRNL